MAPRTLEPVPSGVGSSFVDWWNDHSTQSTNQPVEKTMHQELALLATITVALLIAFVGGAAAVRLGLPTLVGHPARGHGDWPFYSWLCGR